jgi:hypothetical protein
MMLTFHHSHVLPEKPRPYVSVAAFKMGGISSAIAGDVAHFITIRLPLTYTIVAPSRTIGEGVLTG